ncbi:hypothetical protein ABR147_002341 [Pseudomonas aeruginosa]|uniref:hypothetical protein n=1 Tax=Pseudomonas aeruginosa TaxID=287 RepID=UPI00053D6176|nr:hypothetical protein [Pseudomonas aeruginosa]EIU3949901.1 hypothetical protein [Pseudomonas aeruginosa]EIU3963121.1 hypothetical protein [Pseudomonas aeruginosa]EIU6916007.1 hypothetical protein [Pseudomonas aeruginosa]EKI0101801.1 hypothetical protein [Pseudomonas aeruginosa]EKT8188309.1 hypothetical protein [Pseudomonas aeruginosa]
MSNVEVYLPAVDGSAYWPVSKDDSCKEAVHVLFTDDFAAPPHRLVIEVITESGKKVEVSIPYSDTGKATVRVDGKPV